MVMRVLKYGVIALLGYAAYQFIRGMIEGEEAIDLSQKQAPRSEPQQRANPAVMTGGGVGRVVTTNDAVGTSAPHRVGRGVVHR